jgi:hypothetical protein
MPRIKQEEVNHQVEGYIDEEKRVFIVTKDDGGILRCSTPPEVKENAEDMSEIIKKYKPEFLK